MYAPCSRKYMKLQLRTNVQRCGHSCRVRNRTSVDGSSEWIYALIARTYIPRWFENQDNSTPEQSQVRLTALCLAHTES